MADWGNSDDLGSELNPSQPSYGFYRVVFPIVLLIAACVILKKKRRSERRCEELMTYNQRLEKRCQAITTECNQLEERCETLSNETKLLLQRNRNLSSKNEKLEERCKELMDYKQLILQGYRNLSSENEKLGKRCTALTIENNQLEKRSEELMEDNKQQGLSNKKLLDNVRRLEEHCAKVMIEKWRLEKSSEELMENNQLLEENCEALTTENNQSTQRVEALKRNNKSQKRRCKSLSNNNKKLQEKQAELETENGSLRKNISIKDEEIRILNEKLKARYMLLEVDRDSQKFLKLESAFLKSAKNLFVVKIEEVVNKSLRVNYVARKKTVKEECDTSVNIKQELWHGTTKDSVDGICENGFNRSFAGKNDTAYGKGSYFSKAAGGSVRFSLHHNSTRSDNNGKTNERENYYMFLNRVLTGKYCQGKREDMDTPPGYHSTVDNLQSPSRFIVYRDASAYPKYLFTFRVTSSFSVKQ